MRALFIIFLYFLFDRGCCQILHSEALLSIYTFLSKCFTVFVILKVFMQQGNKKTLKIMGYISLAFLSILMSTLIKEGDVRRAVMGMYPVLGMGGLMLWQCSTLEKTKYFIQIIARFYFVLVTINLLFLLVSPSFFTNSMVSGDTYFLGLENQVGYPIMIGLLFMLLEAFFCQKKNILYIYMAMHVVTILIIFSGSNVVGLVCMLLFIIPGTIRCKMTCYSLNFLLLCFTLFFIVVILLGNLNAVLGSSLISYIIEDMLGKNLTLTNRTVIWDIVISGFLESPVIGNGVRSTMNLFYISEQYTRGYMSAHNQILQTLYESGILFFLSILPLVNALNKSLKNTNPFVGLVIKSCICSFLIMFMAEAPGMDKLINLFITGLLISKTLVYFPHNTYRKSTSF